MKKSITVFISVLLIISMLTSCFALKPIFGKIAGNNSSEPSSAIPESSEPSSVEPEPVVDELTDDFMMTTAAQLINAWDNYINTGVCCDLLPGNYPEIEPLVDPDIMASAGSIEMCSCCYSVQEARKHIEKFLDAPLIDDDFSRRLFEYDGRLYCILDAVGFTSHDLSNITVVKKTDDIFSATSDLLGSGGDVVGRDEFWIRKNNKNYIIYVVKSIGESVSEPESKPESEPASEVTSEVEVKKEKLIKPKEIYDIGYHCHVNADGGLTLRYGPGKSYGKIRVIPDGTALVEKGYSDGWIYVEYKGQYGWVSSEFVIFDEGGMAKPVIYLYPPKKTDVKVSLNIKNGALTCTYPQYNNGWNVTAYPNGKIINKADSLEYSYLYWEAESNTRYDLSEGYVVSGRDTATFLRTTLSKMGLTPKEYNEFIVYWLPLMQGNKYNLITFQKEIYTDAAKLNISPKPDSTLRVFMAFKALDKPVSVKAPAIEKFERKGFTVVEWGGTEIK